MPKMDQEQERQELTRRLMAPLSEDEGELAKLESDLTEWATQHPDDMLVLSAGNSFARRLSLYRAHRDSI